MMCDHLADEALIDEDEEEGEDRCIGEADAFGRALLLF
jgi:hypothetical protein